MLRITVTRILSKNSVRLFSNTSRTSNLIQDLYLKELTSVRNGLDMSKIASPKGNVLEWQTPSRPVIPKIEGNEDALLQDYIASKVSVMNESGPGQTQSEQELEEDWLVIEDIQEENPVHAH